MLSQLSQFDFCHLHKRVDFVFGALEVFNAECVDGYYLDTSFVAYFQDLGEISFVWIYVVEKLLTLARASKPRLCPSTVSMPCVLANRLLPSMTKATC